MQADTTEQQEVTIVGQPQTGLVDLMIPTSMNLRKVANDVGNWALRSLTPDLEGWSVWPGKLDVSGYAISLTDLSERDTPAIPIGKVLWLGTRQAGQPRKAQVTTETNEYGRRLDLTRYQPFLDE